MKMNKEYTIRTEPTGYDFDVYYVLEQDSKEVFKLKGSSLFDTYALFGHDMELLKIVMHHGKNNPKEATDYFVEETFKKFMDKLQERRQSLFANPNNQQQDSLRKEGIEVILNAYKKATGA